MKKLWVLHVIPWFILSGVERVILDLLPNIDTEKFEMGKEMVKVHEKLYTNAFVQLA